MTGAPRPTPAPAPAAPDARVRCGWAKASLPVYVTYHDTEWGVPEHDDQRLFEMIVLEGHQAGLSWETILKKRDAYREAFQGFDPARVARYGARELRRLLGDARLIRNRAKMEAAIANARAFLAVQQAFGSFDRYMWRFVDGRPKVNRFRTLRDIPAATPESEAMSKDLRARGFKFVGPTICYAHMQATGMVNDHLVTCFRHRQLLRAR